MTYSHAERIRQIVAREIALAAPAHTPQGEPYMTARSPLLDSADRAACYFDRKRKAGERTGGGRWVSFLRVGDSIHLAEWRTEAEARAHVGLEGGSQDPAYRPLQGGTGYEVAKGAEA